MVKQMQIPIQISFEHVEHSNGIEQRVHEELEKLEQFCDRLTKARVVVGKDQHRHRKGDSYNVQIILTLPGAQDIVIARNPAETGRHEDLSVAISDAFSAARRRLQDLVRKRQRRPKANDADSGHS